MFSVTPWNESLRQLMAIVSLLFHAYLSYFSVLFVIPSVYLANIQFSLPCIPSTWLIKMSGGENDSPGGGGLPSQKSLEDLEERVVQRILSRVARLDAGEGSSGGPKEGV